MGPVLRWRTATLDRRPPPQGCENLAAIHALGRWPKPCLQRVHGPFPPIRLGNPPIRRFPAPPPQLRTGVLGRPHGLLACTGVPLPVPCGRLYATNA